MPIDPDSVRKALAGVRYPGYSRDIVAFGLVKGVDVSPEGKVSVGLAVTTADPEVPRKLYADIEGALGALGIRNPEIAITVTVPKTGPAAPTVTGAPGGATSSSSISVRTSRFLRRASLRGSCQTRGRSSARARRPTTSTAGAVAIVASRVLRKPVIFE